MVDQGNKSTDIARWRPRAEEKIRENSFDFTVSSVLRSVEEAQKLIHELQVHQIELEMQNEELQRTQHELTVERASYFSLYDLAPVGYITVNCEGFILKTNLAAARILDRVREDLLNQSFYQTIYPEDQDIFYLCRKKVLKTSKLQACELRMVKKNGAPFWVSLACSTERFETDAPSYLIVLSDITDRRRLDEALKESEEKFRLLFEHSADAHVLFKNNDFIDCNQAAIALLGLRDKEQLLNSAWKKIKKC